MLASNRSAFTRRKGREGRRKRECLRLARSCVAAGPCFVKQEPGCRAVRLERSHKRLARGALVSGRASVPCRSRGGTARRASQLHGHICGPVERMEVHHRQVRRRFRGKPVDEPAGRGEGAGGAACRQLRQSTDVAHSGCENGSQDCSGQEPCHCLSVLVARCTAGQEAQDQHDNTTLWSRRGPTF